MLDIRGLLKNNKGNGVIIVIAIVAIVVIAVVAVALIWNAMKNSAEDISTFTPSLGTILLVAFIAGAIIALIVFVVFKR